MKSGQQARADRQVDPPFAKPFTAKLRCCLLACAALLLSDQRLSAETISRALARAYMNNPDLNQQRAATRATDEVVARSKAAYRPQISATGSFGYANSDETLDTLRTKGSSFPTTVGVTVSENIFNGNRTTNGVRQAVSQVFQAREQMRNTEQTVLQGGATAYMNVLRDTAILELDHNDIAVLEEQLRNTRDRQEAGALTRTDVAQAESSLATSRANYFTAQANLQTSIGSYRQFIGVQPKRLEAARPIDTLLPRSLDEAITIALSEHPAIVAAFHNVDIASFQVQLAEGQLYPNINIVGNVQNNTQYSGSPNNRLFSASALAQISVPIYSGGDTYASVRQAKELVGQARLQADLQRDMVRAQVVSTWGQLVTSKAVIRSSQAAVKAAEIALNGVRDEAKVGQRTTLDVLMAQQTLLQSRVRLVSAQRDRVVASYTVDAAIGRLSAANLALDVTVYDPEVHLYQIKDKWVGLRTADGR